MRQFRFLAACLLVASFTFGSAQAESIDEQRERVNRNVVAIVGGSISGTYSKILWDMSTLFDDGYNLRVLPILGKGSFKGVEDLLLLRGIDAALVQSDVLDYMVELGIHPDIHRLMRYITVLFNEEVHLLVRNETASIQDLEGKRVNFGPSTSGNFITSSILFDRLGLTVEALSESHQNAVELLKKGEIDAVVRVAGAPVKLLESISWDDGIKLLDIPSIEGSYYEAELSSGLYPELVPQGETRKTIAVGSVLAAYNWPFDHPRREPIEKLFTKLQDRYTEFQQDPYHPKWKEVDFDRDLPGWTRWENSEPSS